MIYITKEIFTTKRDTSLFSWLDQARDEERQALEYINSKLGNKYNTTEINPPQRKKIACPMDCGNTYVWIKRIYSTTDKQKQILCAECARIDCGEIFYLYQEISHA